MELNIIKYCAEECIRQQSGMISIYDMCNAWDYASSKVGKHDDDCSTVMHFHGTEKITPEFIEHLGSLVEPQKNYSGFRQIPIYVGSNEKMNWERVPNALAILTEQYYAGHLNYKELTLSARSNEQWELYKYYKKAECDEDIFYFEYEGIHPFRDGNGRTGKILYNYLLDRMDNPILPPNFWGSSNP